jgi:hypothetical protein
MRKVLAVAVLLLSTLCTAQEARNKRAEETLSRARSNAGLTTSQCKADLNAWQQAETDWYHRERKQLADGTRAFSPDSNPWPASLLSAEELYRRAEESDFCTNEGSGTWEQRIQWRSDFEGLANQYHDELLRRAMEVLDNNNLLPQLLETGGQ